MPKPKPTAKTGRPKSVMAYTAVGIAKQSPILVVGKDRSIVKASRPQRTALAEVQLRLAHALAKMKVSGMIAEQVSQSTTIEDGLEFLKVHILVADPIYGNDDALDEVYSRIKAAQARGVTIVPSIHPDRRAAQL